MFKALKNILKKIPILWKALAWIKEHIIILLRLKDVSMMILLFHFWPEKVYKFSTRNALPCKKNRFSKKERPIIPYDLIKDNCSTISKMKEINIIGRGSSFDLNNLKKMSEPIFLISFWNSLKADCNNEIFYKHYFSYETGKFLDTRKTMTAKDFDDYLSNQLDSPDYKQKNITYVISRPKVIETLKKNGHNVLSIEVYKMNKEGKHLSELYESPSYLSLVDNDQCKHLSIAEKVYKTPILEPHPDLVPIGSLLPCLCALTYYAEKINVYGWDSHLNSSPKKMSYWKLLFSMYKYKTDVFRWKAQFEHALINFYYGYQFSKLPNVNIQGYMGQLGKHEKLIKKIERVLFN